MSKGKSSEGDGRCSLRADPKRSGEFGLPRLASFNLLPPPRLILHVCLLETEVFLIIRGPVARPAKCLRLRARC
jgi:hypothetical protein